MSAEHTPAPWTIYNDGTVISIIANGICQSGLGIAYSLAKISPARGLLMTEKQAAANARLMSASPDLLDAIKRLLAKVECGTALECPLCDAARAAIAKAEGRS